MKKINIILEGMSIDIPPLRRDSEGYLRGGFVGIGGNNIAIGSQFANKTCTNYDCTSSNGTNGTCTNYDCDLLDMANNTCTNHNCKFTTTGTTNTAKAGCTISNLLI